MSRVSYMKVLSCEAESFRVQNDVGFEWTISKNIVENECEPPFQFRLSKVEKVTQTELARILLEETRGAVVSLNFTKKQTPERVLEMIGESNMDLMPAREKKKFAASLMVGELRHLVGHVTGIDVSGRIKMVDLNIEKAYKIRLVDPRTLKDVTFRGVRYEKK